MTTNTDIDSNIIIRIAARGDGMTADGRPFAMTAPGDRIAADGSVIAGPARATPPCAHFPQCGGCQLQHLNDDAYAAYVRDRVIGGLAGQDISAGDVLAAYVSPPQTRSRASFKAMMHGTQVAIGFNAARSHDIVDMRMCSVLHPALFNLLDPLRSLVRRLGKQKRLVEIGMTLADQGVDLMVKGITTHSLPDTEWLSDFAANNKLARLSIDEGEGPETRWEPDPVTVALGGIAVGLPIGAFLQATKDGEATLVDAVHDVVGDRLIIADLFSGLGTFALSFPAARTIYVAEASREAVFSLKSAAAMAQRRVAADHRDLYRRPLTAADASRFDAIILDPPRAGAEEQAKELAQSTCARIAYVSCNPASFARDAKLLLAGGYGLDWVKPVGQFRWSTHVELVAQFSR